MESVPTRIVDTASLPETKRYDLKKQALRLKVLANIRSTYIECSVCKLLRFDRRIQDPELVPSDWECVMGGFKCRVRSDDDFSTADPTFEAAGGVLIDAQYTVGTVVWISRPFRCGKKDLGGGFTGIIDDEIRADDIGDFYWPAVHYKSNKKKAIVRPLEIGCNDFSSRMTVGPRRKEVLTIHPGISN
jgi:hypothetical protein